MMQGVLSVSDLMINDDEPLLRSRSGVDALKMTLSSPHKTMTRLITCFYRVAIIVIIGLAVGVLYSNAQEEQPPVVRDVAVQRYNACVFGKNLEQGYRTVGEFFYDEECAQRAHADVSGTSPLEAQLADLLAGTPMAQMAPTIATQDQTVAAFIVGIAHIESQWGRYAPRKNGEDCYNYWGIKTTGARGSVAGGYGCFGTPEEAVTVVGTYIHRYVYDKNRTTPSAMVLPWKCGGSCASHSPESVSRWVSTVSAQYYRVMAMDASPQLADLTNTKTTTLSLHKK